MKRVLCLVLVLFMMGSACAETLKQGDWSDAVAEVQERLIELGYLYGKADGIFGPATSAAVKVFQYLHVMEQTGRVDEETRERLFSDEVYVFQPALRAGDEGEAVTELQQRLIGFGFMNGSADGVYGADTAEAVTAFQEHLTRQGISEQLQPGLVEGVATGLMQAYLFDPYYTTYVDTFREGDEHEEVRRLERRLVALGYLDGTPDARYDGYTAAVVAAFQQAAGLAVTGESDRASVDAMFTASAPSAVEYVPHDVNKGDAGEVVRAAQRALIRLGMLEGAPDGVFGSGTEAALGRLYEYLAAHGSDDAQAFENSGVISVRAQALLAGEDLVWVDGHIGEASGAEEIMRLQRRLNALYYLPRTAIDGVFGESTQEALRAFQQANGLRPSATAGYLTQQTLFSEAAVAHKTPYLLEVSIADQRVYVNELGGDGEYDRIFEFICSTGMGDRTPTGVFLETRRLSYWHKFSQFDAWAQYTFQIEGNIFFHSILYDEQDVDTVDEISVANLGKKASHGCVRLLPEDAGWIFENCKKGTIVVIY